jgi:hypothetical protein
MTILAWIQKLEYEYMGIRYSIYKSNTQFYLNVTAGSLTLGVVVFFILEIALVGNKKLIRCAALFQVCFTVFLLILAVISYLMGFKAESVKVVSTAYCGNTLDLLADERDTLSILPEYIRPLAKECLYDSGEGNLSNMLALSTTQYFNVVEDYFKILSQNYSWLPYDKG